MERMRRSISLAVLALFALSTARAAEPDYAGAFAGRDGCFELYDLKTGTIVARYGEKRCATRTSPCSTFKVPLALMAFDAGVLKDETSSIEWDGTKYGREEWNQDQTAATWMKYSVVWFSQRLTPKLGMAKVKSYLGKFDYGNRDMSGGLTRAWLESSLKISPDEQLGFWKRFWREEIPVSKHAYEMTKKITLVETSPDGWTLSGKTGTGRVGEAKDGKPLWLGWFAGHIAKGDRDYVFVTSFTDLVPSSDDRPAGPIARELSTKILTQLGLY
jgi:beta-lactamase class D